MKYQIFALAVLAGSFIGCDSDDPEPEEEIQKKPFFTVTVDPAYTFGGDMDNWVFATNASGELLDGKAFVAGDEVILESEETVNGNFNIHFLQVDSRTSAGPFFHLYSYNDVPSAGSWKVVNPKNPNTPIPTNVVGQMQIKLKNFPAQPDVQANENIKVSGPVGNQISSMIGSGSSYDIVLSVLNINTNLIVSFSKDQHSYYAEIPATPGSIVNLDADVDFELVEKEFTFHLENSSYAHIGFYGYNTGDDTSKSGYIISERIDYQGNVAGAFGYITGFDKYRTIIYYVEGNNSRTYHKFGGTIESDPDFGPVVTTTTKKGITDYVCNVGLPYELATIVFNNPTTNDVLWEIMSPRKSVGPELKLTIKELPEELSSKYPSLNLSQLQFKSGGAADYLDNLTYQDVLLFKSNVNGGTQGYSDEYYYYEWQ